MSAKTEAAAVRLGDAIKALLGHPAMERIAELGPALPEDFEEPVACARCRDTGYLRRNVGPDDPNFGKLLECNCAVVQERIQRRLERLWADTDIPPAKREYTLESLAEIDSTRAAFAADLRAWQANPVRWLVLLGPKGTAKSGGAISLLLEHIRNGGSGRYVSVPALLKGIRKTYKPGSDGDEDEALQVLIDAGLLVLDDLGVEKLTEWGQEKLWYVIDKRDGLNTRDDPHPTIITTNLSISELPTYLDPHARTWDRIRGWADIIQTRGDSVRGRAPRRPQSDLPF